jgi:small subunit ribosomal protein S18
MKKNLNISNEELLKLDYKHTHLLKKFTNENGKIIPQRVTQMTRSIHTKITKPIKQARFLSLI